jgi:TolA-binding protein
MENSYDDIVLLEKYIENSLSDSERMVVEQRLSTEESLRELYHQEKLLVRGIRFGHLKEKLNELRKLDNQLQDAHRENKEAKVVSLGTYWKIAAIAASLITIVASYFLINRPVEPDALFAQYFQVYPNILEPVVRGTTEQNKRAESFAAYERGDYDMAAEGFKELLKDHEEPGVLLLLGNANLMLGNTKEAKENFVTLNKDYNDLDLQAKWYLSLCYLKLSKSDSAKVLLLEVAAEKNTYSDRATEILKKLK